MAHPASDPLVVALTKLVEREGGRSVVADKIEASEQSLYQIIKGVRDSKTGNPKGVGPQLRAKLSEKYPGWMSLAGTGPAVVAQSPDGRKGFTDASNEPSGRVMLPLISGGSMQLIDRPNDDREVAALPKEAGLHCEHTSSSKLYITQSSIAGTRIRAGDMLEFAPAARPLTEDDVVALRDSDGMIFIRRHDPTFEKNHRLDVVAVMVQFQGRSAV